MVSRESVDSVKARADEECNLDEIQPDELEKDAYNTKEQKSNKLCTLITCYFREDGKVKCSCATKTTVVRKPFFVVPIKDGEEKPKGTELYPIVAGYYEKRDRCIYGLSEVEGLIPNQKSVNFHFAMSLLNAQENAWGKWLVKPNALKGQKITNVPGQVLVDYSGTGDGIKKLTEKTMQTFPLDVVNNLVSMTRSVSGASEVMTGETIGANMSGAAIAQLQAQAEKPIDDLRDTFWLVKKKQGKVLAQFYKHFYLDADFAYENKADGKDEKQMIQDKFTSSDYQGVNFDIVVEATQGTRSSAAADIAILEALLARGLISLETFIKSYPDEAIGNKSSILEAIKASQTNELAMAKQMLEQSQAREKELESVIKSQAEMVDNVYSIVKELQNTKKLLVDVATEEIELAKEAEAKINKGNEIITGQTDFLRGILGLPRDAKIQVPTAPAPFTKES